MRFAKMMTNEEWDQQYSKCKKFANLQLDTSQDQYRRRNQSNPTRIVQQIADGKMGELLAYDHMKRLGFECTEPDFAIYTARFKSFDADLISGNTHVHVKSQNRTSADKYGTSWVFQAGGRGFGHVDPCVQEGESWCIFVVVDHETHSAEIHGPLDMVNVRPHFKDPKLQHLVGIKKCIYLADIDSVARCIPPATTLKHDTVMDCLDRCLKAWTAGNFCMECELEGDDLSTARDNDWAYEIDDLILYDVQKMIDTALGKIELSQYKVEFSKVGLPDEYRWDVEHSSSDTDPEDMSEAEAEAEAEAEPPRKKVKYGESESVKSV